MENEILPHRKIIILEFIIELRDALNHGDIAEVNKLIKTNRPNFEAFQRLHPEEFEKLYGDVISLINK